MRKVCNLYNILRNLNNGVSNVIPKFFFGYLIAGILAVLALFIIQSILIYFFQIKFLITQIVSTCLAIFVSFTINNIFTFKKRNKKSLSRKITQFFITNLLSMILNVSIANYIFKILEIWFIASLAGICIAVFFNFFIYKYKIWNDVSIK